MKISSTVVGDYNDGNNFLQKLLLTKAKFSKLPKAFANNSSASMKLSKTQLHKIGQSGGFLGRLLGQLLKTGFPLIRNLLKPLAKCVLILLGLITAASVTDAAIHKKKFGSSVTTLIISNEEMNDIMEIVKSPKESGLLIKGVIQTIKNEAKEQKRGFFIMLSCTLGASLIGNLLTSKSTIRAGEGSIATSQGQGTVRVGQDF